MQELHSPFTVGAVIQERYIVESLLGQGHFGYIYLVRDQHGKQELFTLAEVINPDDQERYRLTLEYVSSSPLNRRALPRAQYAFNDDKLRRAYVLMRSIEEPNLEQLRLRQAEKRFSLSRVIETMVPVIDSVAFLHQQEPPVIHLNIQPASILLSKSDKPVVLILGIAKERDSTSVALHYFAPGYGAIEQYQDESSASSDIYGLGATCYTLLTGIIPPDALSRSIQLGMGESDPLVPVGEIIPAISTSIAEVIQRAMSIAANDRFSSVEQFREAMVSRQSEFSSHLLSSVPSSSRPALAVSGQALESPAATSSVKQLRNPVARLPTLRSGLFRQTGPRPATASDVEHSRTRRSWKLAAASIVLALLIGLGISARLLSHMRSLPAAHSTTLTPGVKPFRPIPTSAPSTYPTLTETYTGTIVDLSVNVSTGMSLLRIRQSHGNISGYLVLGSKLQGIGPFSGTIDSAKRLQFTVTDATGHSLLFFEGVIQSATSLSGDYFRCSHLNPARDSRCSQGPGSYGIWGVVSTRLTSITMRMPRRVFLPWDHRAYGTFP